jgi:hypothetical protein
MQPVRLPSRTVLRAVFIERGNDRGVLVPGTNRGGVRIALAIGEVRSYIYSSGKFQRAHFRHMKLRTCSKLALLTMATTFTALSLEPASSEVQPNVANGAIIASNLPGVASLNTNAEPVKIVPPATVNLPPTLADVVRLVKSGIDESVIVAYLEKSPPDPPLTAAQVIYLQDLGLSSGMIRTLIQHSQGTLAPAMEVVETPNNNPAEPETIESGATTSAPSVPPSPSQSEQPTGPAAEFYADLAPYGSWMNVPGYGWCWQPSVVVVNPAWQPYCNNGYWMYSDWGWYWNSYYSWGWAPFHYGRWFCYGNSGWLWCPDHVWGPSWVCWRHSADYCGWAPLPPGAEFTAGVGWTYHGGHVGFNFGFGLGPAAFTFVSDRDFNHHQVSEHRVPSEAVNKFFNHTTPSNRYETSADHHVINQGIGLKRIEAATHTSIHPVAIHELPAAGDRTTQPGELVQRGSSKIIYRPSTPGAVPRHPDLANLGQPRASAPGAKNYSSRSTAALRMEQSAGDSAATHSRPNLSVRQPQLPSPQPGSSSTSLRSSTRAAIESNQPGHASVSANPNSRHVFSGPMTQSPPAVRSPQSAGLNRSAVRGPQESALQARPISPSHLNFSHGPSMPRASPSISMAPRFNTFANSPAISRPTFSSPAAAPSFRAPSFSAPGIGSRSFGARSAPSSGNRMSPAPGMSPRGFVGSSRSSRSGESLSGRR